MRYLIILPILFSIFTSNAQVELSEKENQMFQLIKTTKFFDNFHGPQYFDVYAYDFERLEDGSLKMIPKNIRNVYSDPLAGDKTAYYIIDEERSGYSIVEYFNQCGIQDGFIRITKWENGKATQIATRPSKAGGEVAYNAKGLPECFNAGIGYRGKKNKKVYTGRNFCLSYDDQNRIISASKVIQNYKGKESNDLKPTNKFTEWEIKVIYGDKRIAFTLSQYKDTGKNPQPFQKKEFEIYSKDDQNIWTSKTFSGSPMVETYSSEMIHTYNDDGSLNQKTEINKDQTITEDFEYDQSNRMVKHTRTRNSQRYGVQKVVTSNTFNNLNLISDQVYEKFQDGKLDQLKESSYTYSVLEKHDEISECYHKKEMFSKIYNGEKEIVQEIKGSKTRVKEFGVWGEWKFFQM
jgi:hypothetical protein